LYVINSATNIFIYSLDPLTRSRFTRHSALHEVALCPPKLET